jgi:hypothetical protein
MGNECLPFETQPGGWEQYFWMLPAHYQRLYSDTELSLLLHQHCTSSGREECLEVICQPDTASGILKLEPLTWDSKHFGVRMWVLHVHCPSQMRADVVLSGLHRLFERMSEEIDYVVCQVVTQAIEVFNALMMFGFVLKDQKMAMGRRVNREHANTSRVLFHSRPYHAKDYSAIMQLVSCASFPSRFSREPNLDAGRVKEMYQEWLDGLIGASDPDRVIAIVEQSGGVVAFAAAGVVMQPWMMPRHRIMTRALAVCAPGHAGAGLAAGAGLLQQAAGKADYAEMIISLSNRVMQRGLSYLGMHLDYSQYVLSKWL